MSDECGSVDVGMACLGSVPGSRDEASGSDSRRPKCSSKKGRGDRLHAEPTGTGGVCGGDWGAVGFETKGGVIAREGVCGLGCARGRLSPSARRSIFNPKPAVASALRVIRPEWSCASVGEGCDGRRMGLGVRSGTHGVGKRVWDGV